MTVAIVTDSAAAIPPELAANNGISVVPMWIHLGDTTIAEGERPLGEFLGDERITTSAPAPGDYERVIRRRIDDGADAVVVLTIAGTMSASYQSASVAARDVGDHVAGRRHRDGRGRPGAGGAGGGSGCESGRIAERGHGGGQRGGNSRPAPRHGAAPRTPRPQWTRARSRRAGPVVRSASTRCSSCATDASSGCVPRSGRTRRSTAWWRGSNGHKSRTRVRTFRRCTRSRRMPLPRCSHGSRTRSMWRRGSSASSGR